MPQIDRSKIDVAQKLEAEARAFIEKARGLAEELRSAPEDRQAELEKKARDYVDQGRKLHTYAKQLLENGAQPNG